MYALLDTHVLRPKRRSGRAFTLIEVILAISIATGLLIVALTFYRQVSDLRGQILQESERLATVRLMLDRLASDLRTVRTGAVAGQEFRGDASALSFVTAVAALPTPGATPGSISGGADSARISLSTVTAQEGTNGVTVVGLLRRSEPVVTVSGAASEGTTSVRLGDSTLEQTNRWTEPTTELIRYVRFRYWSGSAWQSGWTNSAPPPGVEIVLGTEPQPDDGAADYPYEQFRRVVYLPAGVAQETATDDPLGVGGTP